MIIDCAIAKKKALALRYAIIIVMALIVLCDFAMAWSGGKNLAGTMYEITTSAPELLARHPHLFLIETVSVSMIYLAGLYRLVKLMRVFEQGEFFSVRAVGHLRAFALSILLAVLAGCLFPTLELLAAHILGLNRDASISFSVDSSDVWLGLVSALFFIIALIMSEAGKVAEDSQLIV